METMETKVNTTNETESAAHQTGMMDIKDFDYDTYLLRIQNKDELKKLYDSTDSSISKLQILRMIVNLTGRKVENQVFWDYLTEYYHVENNEMTSLDEKKFDVVPNYIMKMSDEIIGEIFK